MCGVAGFMGGGSREALQRMAGAIAHRGPDDEGFFCENGIGLAHARLSIIDTSPAGHQPMWNGAKDVAIIFNGEIYNFLSLKKELQKNGVAFNTHTDTEVILKLYEREGEKCFEKLSGMFALAIFDTKKQALILARDRMGEKPLYWSLQKGIFSFASELGALMQSGLVEKHIDLTSFNKYLLFDYVPTPHTILQGVYKLEPGTCLVYENGAVRKHVFWHPPATLSSMPEAEALSCLDTLLHESVKGQLISDVPLGVFLSGGIDSSTVAWYAKHHTPNIDTFSIGFEDPSFDESSFAREVALHLGTNHHERVVTAKEALDVIPQIPNIFSEPVADASVIPTALLSTFARGSVTVSLGGDGGDELFAGYPTFGAERLFGHYQRLPHALQSISKDIINALPANDGNFSLSFNLKKFVSSAQRERERRHMEWAGSHPPQGEGVFEDVDRYVSEFLQPDPMNRLLWVYARMYLMDEVLVKVDRASMHHALEVRAPYLDREVVEHVFSLPFAMKYKRGETKHLLKALMRGRLPDRILDRKKKGFGVPMSKWLKEDLRELCGTLLSPDSTGVHGLFDAAYVERLKDNHWGGITDNRKPLWNLMVFQMWYNRWMPRK